MSEFTAERLKETINEFINEALAYLQRTEDTMYVDNTGCYPSIEDNPSNEKLAYILQGGDIDLLNKILDKAIKEGINNEEE